MRQFCRLCFRDIDLHEGITYLELNRKTGIYYPEGKLDDWENRVELPFHEICAKELMIESRWKQTK